MGVQKNSKPMSTYIILMLVLIGLAAGILSGLIGVGGGIIVVPALILLLGFSQQQAQGTSLGLLLLPVGILAVMNYYKAGYIDVKVVVVMSVAFIVGAYFGSKLSLVLPPETVKKIFAFMLLYTAAKMLHWDAFIIKWIKSVF